MKKSSENDEKGRLPPGQHLTNRFPVLQKGNIVHINRNDYVLKIQGEIQNSLELRLSELKELYDKEITADIHCVTSWSKFDTKWGGISFSKLLQIVKPTENANFVEFYCAVNSILALTYDGKPINDKHGGPGGPVRTIIPHLYFYKSAKWVIKINFLQEDRLGYWEQGGYSNQANPWKEQRYSYHDEK